MDEIRIEKVEQEVEVNDEKEQKWKKIRSHFVIRLLVWAFGFIMFCFGLVLLYGSGIGYVTVDVIWQNLRALTGVSMKWYGLAILTPCALLFMWLPAVVVSYLRIRSVPLHYWLCLIPTIFAGFLIQGMMGLPFVKEMLNHVVKEGTQVIARPIYNLTALGGFILYAVGLGILSGARLFSNVLVILILEMSELFKIKFSNMQKIIDLTLFSLGFIFGICAIYIAHNYTWSNFLSTFNWITLITLILQGFIIHFWNTKTIKFLMLP